MQVNKEIIANFRNFIQTINSIDSAQKTLKDFRNITIDKFNLKESRCIWMSLLLYKFKSDMEVSEELWKSARNVILSILRSDLNLKDVLTNYLNEFNKWQKEDLVDFVTQVGGNYYNLLQIKKSIENTGNEETINHWLPHYENLIQKIRSYCKSIGILDKVDEFVLAFEQQKFDIVKEIMDKVYWDKIEEDLNENNLDIVYNNLNDLKITLLDIIPKSVIKNDLNEYFDMDYIKHLVENNILDKEYLLGLFKYVINILKEWDAESFKEKYENELIEINKVDGTYNHFIRCIIQRLMVLSIDLKNRKALWNIILTK